MAYRILPRYAKEMVVTIELPDDIARSLATESAPDLARQILEGFALEGYREERFTQKQVGELLGLSRIQTEDFLAAHLPLYSYDPAELARELKDLSTLRPH